MSNQTVEQIAKVISEYLSKKPVQDYGVDSTELAEYILQSQPLSAPVEATPYLLYENDKVNSILSICLQKLSNEQLCVLRDCLTERTPKLVEAGAGVSEEKSIEAWRAEGLPLLMAMVRTGYSQAALDISQFCIENDVPEALTDKVISMLNSDNKREFVYDLFKQELEASDLLPSTPPTKEAEAGLSALIKWLDTDNQIDQYAIGKVKDKAISLLEEYKRQPADKNNIDEDKIPLGYRAV